MTFMKVENVSKFYNADEKQLTVLDNINFELEQKELLCILGHSGCGKTTLLRSIAGFEKPSHGKITINGLEVTKPSPHVSVVFQTFDQLFPWLTVIGNVRYPLHINQPKASKKELTEIAENYLRLVHLNEFRDYYPHQLSGGMKQRIAIARSLALQPQVLLMDEPFASLDAEARTELQKELLRIWHDAGITIIFVTHSIIEAISIGSKLMVLGSDTNGIKLFCDNPVEGGPTELKTPDHKGYAECWTQLRNMIKK